MIRLRRHLHERELLDHYYGDDRGTAVPEHLARCGSCAAGYGRVAAALDGLARLRLPEVHEDAAFWQRQRAGVERRLRAPLGPRERQTPRPRLAFTAALAAVAALALVTWLPWSAPSPSSVSVAEQDRVDDVLLREIEVAVTAPLGSLGEGEGWPGAAMPTL